MTVSDDTIQLEAEDLGDFVKNLGKKSPNVSKEKAKNVLKNTGQAFVITANTATAAASRNPEVPLSTLAELIAF